MMDSGMQESEKGGVIPIGDSNAEVFEAILTYLYVGATSLPVDAVVELLLVSTRYRLVGLTQQCERFIADNMVFENVLDVYELAKTIDSHVLLNVCKKLVLDFESEIKQLPDYAQFDATNKEVFEVWWKAKALATEIKPKERSVNTWNAYLDEAKSDIYAKAGFGKRDQAAQTSYEDEEEYYSDEDMAKFIYKRPNNSNSGENQGGEEDYDEDDYDE